MGADNFNEVVAELANAKVPVCVSAAAGCGKTTAIVQAVALSEGRQLILTHTNAGVAALRSSLRKNSIPESKYHVDTIASWFLKYAIAYPSMSGLETSRPIGGDWKKVYLATKDLFRFSFIQDVLQASYDGIFIDEYQDCEKQQHEIILRLCEILPTRILGDPMQSIFKFNDNRPVDWETDVLPHFTQLSELITHYRWQGPETNYELGESLSDIRSKLQKSEAIDLTIYAPISWLCWSENQEVLSCKEADRKKSGKIAGIHQWRSSSYNTAKKIEGKYQSIEEMDCEDLINCAKKIDKCLNKGNFVGIASEIKNLILKTCGNRTPFINNGLQEIFDQIGAGNISMIISLLDNIMRDTKMQVYRRELLIEMRRTVQEFGTGVYASIEEAAYIARFRTRTVGRKLENRIISSTLLIKGLEFDHAIVLNADALQNSENFYVAITRASKSLIILSALPTVSYKRSCIMDTR